MADQPSEQQIELRVTQEANDTNTISMISMMVGKYYHRQVQKSICF
jgi:hypothetical protein